MIKIADLCDDHSEKLQIAQPGFQDYGKIVAFHGPIHTIKTFEDNTLVRVALEKPGAGKVLVVDGGGSLRCALVGDKLAQLAINNQWSGIIVNGCIRDSGDIGAMNIGVKALATHPLKSVKNDYGQEDIVLTFAGVTFRPGEFVYVDSDGIVIAEAAVH